MTARARTCFACETGAVRPTNLRGRAFDYRDEFGLIVDRELEVPACDTCGELYLKGGLSKSFSDTMERLRLERKRGAVQHFVHMAEERYPQVSRAAWEDMFGLSRGYLSRLASGARVADTALEILLEGFAREPETAMRLLEVAGHFPQTLRDAVGSPPGKRRLA